MTESVLLMFLSEGVKWSRGLTNLQTYTTDPSGSIMWQLQLLVGVILISSGAGHCLANFKMAGCQK